VPSACLLARPFITLKPGTIKEILQRGAELYSACFQRDAANHEDFLVHFETFLRILDAASHYLDMDRKLLAGRLRVLRARRARVARVFAKVYAHLPRHIDDHDLERYYLGMVKDESELATLEEHLLWCCACVDRAEAAAQ
jgi:hypothetical protein